MVSQLVSSSIWSNNKKIEDFLLREKSFEVFSFKKSNEKHLESYVLAFLDLSADLQVVTSNLLSLYTACQSQQLKLVIVILTEIEGSSEKINSIRELIGKISQHDPIHRLVICQDLYTLNNGESITPFDTLIHRIRETKEVEVSQKGNFLYYPVSLKDLFGVIKKALFLSNTAGKEFFLQGEALSDLNLAYLSKRLLEATQQVDLDINSTSQVRFQRISYQSDALKTSALLNTETTDSFENDTKLFFEKTSEDRLAEDKNRALSKAGKIKHFFARKLHPAKTYIEENPKKIVLGKIKILVEGGVGIISFFYLCSSLIFVSASYGSLKYLEKSLFSLKKGSVEDSSKSLNSSILLKNVSEKNYNLISPVISFFVPETAENSQNFLTFLNYSQSSLQGFHQTYSIAEKFFGSVNTPNPESNFTSLALALKSNLQLAYESVNQVEILLNKSNLPKPLAQKVKQSLEYQDLKKVQTQIGEASKITDLLPLLVGDKKVSNIFLLVQNSQELRSTGGVIDFVYQLSVDKGQLVFQKAYQPQEIDKKDDFSLLPPPLVEKLTGDSVWKLRDMNYNPDFPQTATNISWYLEKKLKTKPDIVISINTSSLEKILAEKEFAGKVSKVTLEEYKSKLRLGEATSLTKEIVDNLVGSVFTHKLTLLDLLTLATVSLSENNTFIWSSDSQIGKGLVNERFSGSIREYECHPAMSSSRLCLTQTSHLNFSNFSLLPINDHLQKSYSHIVTPLVLSIEHQLDINYSYVKKAPLVNRDLAEIVQLYIPKTAQITEIKVNSEIIPPSSLFAQEEGTLTRYQFIISTPLNQDSLLSIKYATPLLERTILPIAYSFTDIKQSGANEGESRLEINIPDQSRVSAITSEVVNMPTKILYKQTLGTNTFGLNLVPKF